MEGGGLGHSGGTGVPQQGFCTWHYRNGGRGPSPSWGAVQALPHVEHSAGKQVAAQLGASTNSTSKQALARTPTVARTENICRDCQMSSSGGHVTFA